MNISYNFYSIILKITVIDKIISFYFVNIEILENCEKTRRYLENDIFIYKIVIKIIISLYSDFNER